ncbi:MAG: CAP domain-containing protein [Thermoguttaceae bacterium]
MKNTILRLMIFVLFLVPCQQSSAHSPILADLGLISRTVSQTIGTTIGSALDVLDCVGSQIQQIIPLDPEKMAVVHVSTQRGARPAQPICEDIDTKSAPFIEMLQQVPSVVDGLILTKAERSVIAITNLERARRGVKPLMPDRNLMLSARKHAAWMSVSGIFRHGNARAAENIAMGQRSSSSAMRSWMNSSGHRSNLLASGHGHIGVGAYQSLGGQMYWCQQFVR